MEVKVINIKDKPSCLHAVVGMWHKDRAYLGFFPDGAFADYAQRHQILVALNSKKECIGYLLYRLSRQRVVIVHLCVDASQRGHGVAQTLVGELKQTTKDFRGIGLHCRRDYEASKLWPKLNFIPRHDKSGRGRDNAYLTYWWFDHGHPDLFTAAREELLQSKIKVVVDANIFYDLQNESSPSYAESFSLMADWIQDDVVLCLTDEIFNEINRSTDMIEIERNRKFTEGFQRIQCREAKFEDLMGQMRPLFPDKMKASDESDLKQLTHAIAAEAHFFVTRDEMLIALADDIYEKYGTTIIRPSDLVVRLDELEREEAYRPKRLCGSLLQSCLVISTSEDELIEPFQCFSLRESKKDFIGRIRTYLAYPNKHEVRVIKDTLQQPLALIVFSRESQHELRIPIIRILNDNFSSTVARFLITESVQVSAKEGRIFTRFTDEYLPTEIKAGLSENYFYELNGSWLKVNLAITDIAAKIKQLLNQLAIKYSDESSYLQKLALSIPRDLSSSDVNHLWNIEKALWPVKIVDLNIPSYIVPIQPVWAMHFFDVEIASQTLFGANPELAMKAENVYYKSKNPGLSSPARILWYVSDNDRHQGSKHVRACSQMDEVAVGVPKHLFQRFRRLGVYQWKDVLGKANGDHGKEIMAFRFSNTESFKRPLPWDVLQNLLIESTGKGNQIQNSIRISSECFFKIYNYGHYLEDDGAK
jgi:predicted nucleic acid-binding protein